MPTYRHIAPEPRAKARLLKLARQRGLLRSRDLSQQGLSRETLRRLVAEGSIVRRGRGLYGLADAPLSEHELLAETSARVPHGVVCLLSALRFHDLTTQNPSELWLAIDRKARAPKVPEVPLRIVRFSGAALAEGVEDHDVNHVTVRVYNPAKTVADCFKYRNKIGLDVALEALQDVWRKRRATMDELWHYATICRVTNVIRPYLEAIVQPQSSV